MSEIIVNVDPEEVPNVIIKVDENSAQAAIDAAAAAQKSAEEARDAVAGTSTIPFLDLRIIAEGSQDGIPNVDKALEYGDTVEGFKDANTYWKSAMYNGGDLEDRENGYDPLVELIWEEEVVPDSNSTPSVDTPLITTGDATNITQNSFTLAATPERIGVGSNWGQSGIQLAINPDFLNYVTISSPTVMELVPFTVNFKNPQYAWGNLAPGTTYYYRAKIVVNPAYEGEIFWYGEVKTVTTLP
jgi:hypothetical protein